MEIVCVPAIVAIVYVLMEAYKAFIAKGRETWTNFIPIIASVIGGGLGVAVYYIVPQIIVATNVWVALIVGVCSGLSATGFNQILKQLKEFGINVKEKEDE